MLPRRLPALRPPRLLGATLLLLAPLASAHAYLDPGSGSFVFQVLAGAIVAVVYSVRSFFRGLLGGGSGEEEADEAADDAPPESAEGPRPPDGP